MADKKLYLVQGWTMNLGLIQEYVRAYSKQQALKIVAERLEKKFPLATVYLGECETIEVTW